MAICQKQIIWHKAELVKGFQFYFAVFISTFLGLLMKCSILRTYFFHLKKTKISWITNMVLWKALSWKAGCAEMRKCNDHSPDPGAQGCPASHLHPHPHPEAASQTLIIKSKYMPLCYLITKPSRKPPIWVKKASLGEVLSTYFFTYMGDTVSIPPHT